MGTDLLTLLKRIVELAMPNLRTYYRITRKAKVVDTYASDGSYWADIQPLRNDESVDDTEPVIPKVEIPIIWAGPNRGVVCPPLPGTFCDLTYYDGDPDYPRISNFRWHVSAAPKCEVDGFIIQQQPGVHIKIDAESNIIHFTPANRISEIGKDRTSKVGDTQLENIGKSNTRMVGEDETITVSKNKTENVEGHRVSNITGDDLTTAATWTIEVPGPARVESNERIEVIAPEIELRGNLTSTGENGEIGTAEERTNKTHEGSLKLIGNLTVEGDITTTGNSDAGTRSGGKL
ncbi:baseplate assembly protein [Desulfovibrio sp. UCD-KL4C]|uniref:bacteriophage T4 gp5 trimerisation domain-containing protein n=1 Tax=Desulfovibrio sp. UCD-KL4C TaxID=2578120 RepID=UPI0025BD0D6D|nr:baseplate assembly protein [Desulfovibrio sp. UCD-KL4C]